MPVRIDILVNSTGANISIRSDHNLLRFATKELSSAADPYPDQPTDLAPPPIREMLTLE